MELADGAPYIEDVRGLIREYTEWFGRDLAFQGLDDELEHVGDKYLPPEGRLIVALDDGGAVVGCVAYHRLDDATAEMKRLYVRPAFRGSGLGSLLVDRIIADAREIGYRQMLLDTLPPLESAIRMYRALGFYEIPCYNDSPVDETIFLCLDL